MRSELRWQILRPDAALLFFRQLRSPIPRRAIGFLLLAVLGVGMVGLPLAAPQPEKTGRFPCEDCPCGCVTADFCWDKCCCHSDREKLQWAQDHGVTPPDFLVARVGEAKVVLVSEPSGSCCCSKSSGKSAAKSTAKCGLPKTSEQTEPQTDQASAGVRWVMLSDAAKCQGIEWIWSLLASVTVEARLPSLVAVEPPLLFCLPLLNERADRGGICPDPPVP